MGKEHAPSFPVTTSQSALAALSPADLGLLEPHLELLSLKVRCDMEKPNTSIRLSRASATRGAARAAVFFGAGFVLFVRQRATKKGQAPAASAAAADLAPHAL